MVKLRHGSLFSGIGGFDLASEWMGWENVFQVEIDKYATKVLEKNFPNVERYKDIYEFNGEKYRGSVDIISGGFPCQPFSVAGKRQGEKDNRFLWFEMLRVIREVQPEWVVAENVAGIVSMENGKTLEKIFASLEDAGYSTESYIIPACAVGAWHRRDRIWIIGRRNTLSDSEHIGRYESEIKRGDPGLQQESTARKEVCNMQSKGTGSIRDDGGRNDGNDNRVNGNLPGSCAGEIQQQGQAKIPGHFASNTKDNRCSWRKNKECRNNKRIIFKKKLKRRTVWCQIKGCDRKQFATNCKGNRMERLRAERFKKPATQVEKEVPGCDCSGSRTGGTNWDFEPGICRVANGVSNRLDRIKGLGNAIVPQVAFEIFKAIQSTYE